MPDETDTTTTAEQIPAAVETTETTTTDATLGDAGMAALVKERAAARAAEKRAAEAEARIKEFEDRDKSEAQKLLEERDALKAERDILAQSNLRRDVADSKGLTPAQAKRLVGTTREEMEADADSILTDFPVTPAIAPFTDVGQGVRQGGNAATYRMSQLNDHAFFLAHKADIEAAIAEGGSRIITD